MTSPKNIAFLIFCLVYSSVIFSQYNLLPDSIKGRLDTMNNRRADKYLIRKSWVMMQSDPGTAMIYSKAHYERGITQKDSLLVANSLVTKGTIYQVVSDFPRSTASLLEAVKIYGLLKDTLRLAIALNNLGNTYSANKDFVNASNCIEKSLAIRIAKKDSSMIRGSYMNLSAIAYEKGDYKQARLYALKSFRYKSTRQTEDHVLYSNYATMLSKLDMPDSAMYFYNVARGLVKDDEQANADIDLNVGSIYLEKNDLKNAEHYLLKASKFYEDKDNELINKNIELKMALYEFHKRKGNFEKALELYTSIEVLNDTIYNQQKSLQMAFFNTEFNVSQKEGEIKNLKQKSVLDEQEKNKIKLVRNFVIGGILLVLCFAFFMYKKSIERKKLSDELQQKNTEITDSINYAKRIQEAMLPPDKFIGKYVNDHFILYKPKDIVAGDFYWAEQLNDCFYIAAADATGHGVPGALVSVVCSNALNRSVNEFNLTDTGKILDKTRDLVLDTFAKSMEGIQDGMDISLLAIKKTGNSGNKQSLNITWSGANFPLWYIDSLQPDTLVELKPNKQSIGKVDEPKPFTTHSIQCSENSIFYLFTDGFADQFGGQKGKKFKYKQLKEILIKNNQSPLKEQASILDKQFENWRGTLEQVDDMTIIGIKV